MVRLTIGVLPAVKVRLALLMPTTVEVVAPVVVCWMAKSPVSVCPRTDSVTPVPEICTNGPARTLIVKLTLSIGSTSSTAAGVVLMATPKVPPKVTPGTLAATVPLNMPATPAPVEIRAPWPPVSITAPPPSDSVTLLAPISSWVPLAVVTWLKAKLPVSVWPRTLSWAFRAWKLVTRSPVANVICTPPVLLPGIDRNWLIG